MIALTRKLIIGKRGNVAAGEPIVSARGGIETAEYIHQRGFAGTGMSHDGDEFSLRNGEVYIKKHLAIDCSGPLYAIIQTINLAKILHIDQRFAGHIFLKRPHQNILNLSLLPDFSLSATSRIIRLSPSLMPPSKISVKLLSAIPVLTSMGMGLSPSSR